MESCCFLFGYVTFDRLLIWSTSSLGICISQLVVWIVNKRGNLCICRAFIPFDHHLTTSSSQPVPFIVFYVPTFFYNHHKQRRKLCTLHNFRRWFMLFACLSQFSDNCGTLDNRQEIARHNVKKQAHYPVVRGRLTTN